MKNILIIIAIGSISLGCSEGSVEPDYNTKADIWLQIDGHDVSKINDVKFSSTGNLLAASFDNKVQFWSVPSWNRNKMLDLPSTVLSIDFSLNGLYFIAACFDHYIYIYDVPTLNLTKKIKHPENDEQSSFYSSRGPAVFSPDSKQLATAIIDERIVVWGTDTWEILNILEGPDLIICNLAYNNSSDKLAAYYLRADSQLLEWDLTSLNSLDIYSDNADWIYSIKYTPNSDLLSCAKGSLDFWDTNSLTLVDTYSLKYPAQYIDYGMEGNLLVNGYEYFTQGPIKGSVEFHFKESDNYQFITNFETSNFYSIDISPNDMFIATCGYSNKIDIYLVDAILNLEP
jgi:WD40 repeat protein